MSSHDINQSRDRLIAGVRRFQKEIYPNQKERYQKVAREGQKPHTLFITCADSRIDPELITQSGPGEIFVLRNIGNIVPAYGEVMGGVTPIIEYAVCELGVGHIVVCGHSDCGAMHGLLHPEKVAGLPTVQAWLRNAEAALSIVRQRSQPEEDSSALEELIEENVLQQLHHLQTHPGVAGALAAGKLALSGWVYDIAHGAVHIYDEGQHKFLAVTSEQPRTSGAAG